MLKTTATLIGAVALALGLTAVPRTASAEEVTAEEPIPGISVTFSPIHLAALPMLEVHIEKSIGDQLGVVGIIGAGGKTLKDDVGQEVNVSFFEIGGQARYYLSKGFEGLHVGGEALLVSVSLSDEESSVSVDAGGVTLGGFGGWKWMAGMGFTFVVQLGYQVAGLAAKARNDESGEEEDRISSDAGVLLNLDFGWSF